MVFQLRRGRPRPCEFELEQTVSWYDVGQAEGLARSSTYVSIRLHTTYAESPVRGCTTVRLNSYIPRLVTQYLLHTGLECYLVALRLLVKNTLPRVKKPNSFTRSRWRNANALQGMYEQPSDARRDLKMPEEKECFALERRNRSTPDLVRQRVLAVVPVQAPSGENAREGKRSRGIQRFIEHGGSDALRFLNMSYIRRGRERIIVHQRTGGISRQSVEGLLPYSGRSGSTHTLCGCACVPLVCSEPCIICPQIQYNSKRPLRVQTCHGCVERRFCLYARCAPDSKVTGTADVLPVAQDHNLHDRCAIACVTVLPDGVDSVCHDLIDEAQVACRNANRFPSAGELTELGANLIERLTLHKLGQGFHVLAQDSM